MSREKEIHAMERNNAMSKRNCWAASTSRHRSKLSQSLVLPFLDKRILAQRKLHSTRIGIKTSTKRNEATLRNTAKVSPRNMGASSQMFKQHTDQQKGAAIVPYLDNELEILDVSSLRWTRDKLAMVGKCKNLIRCDMSNIDTTDAAIIALKACQRLRHLNISKSKISAKTLSDAVPAWRHLHTLQMDSNPQLFDFPNHGSNFLRSKWQDKYEGVGKRALRNYYSFLHRLRMISTTDPKTLKKIVQHKNNNLQDNRLETAIIKGMMNGNVRYLFGQFAVHGGNVVTQDEIKMLSKMVGLGDSGVENNFPMAYDHFALRIVLCLKMGVPGVSWHEFVGLAWKTVGVHVAVDDREGANGGAENSKNKRPSGERQDDVDDGDNNDHGGNPKGSNPEVVPTVVYPIELVAKQVPAVDWGAVLLRSISTLSSLCSLSLSNCLVHNFSWGGYAPPPTIKSHNATHVLKWHEYNHWVGTGRWTSVKLTEKDLKDIAHERKRQQDLRGKIIEFKERLKIVSMEIKSCEKNISEHGRTKRLGKELEKSEKRFKNIQQRIIESKAKIEALDEDISNMGSIIDGETRPLPAPRSMLNDIDLSGNVMNDEGLAFLAARVPYVSKARLSCINGMDEKGILTDAIGPMLVRAWPHLQEIDFAGSIHVGDAVVQTLVHSGGKYSCNLTKLQLGGCKVTANGTTAIANRCESLVELDLTSCLVDQTRLESILKKNMGLLRVRLDFVDLDEGFLEDMKSKYPNVLILCNRHTHYVKPPPKVWKVSDEGKGKKKKKGGKKKKKKK